MGPVWRNEKPGPGRFRQFYQCDADTVGSASVAADAEICAMLADALETVGIPRGDYVVKVNNRKVLNGVMEVAGLAGDDKEAERGIVLRAIDKIDRLGPEGVRALLARAARTRAGISPRVRGCRPSRPKWSWASPPPSATTGADTVARLR
jgi:histidyl-tRNA synthetase